MLLSDVLPQPLSGKSVTALDGSVRIAATDPGIAPSPSLGMPYLDIWIPFMLCPAPS